MVISYLGMYYTKMYTSIIHNDIMIDTYYCYTYIFVEIYFNQSTYFTKNNSDFNFTLVLTSTKPLSGKITVLVKDTSTADDGSTDNGKC